MFSDQRSPTPRAQATPSQWSRGLLRLIAPHASIQDQSQRRRAQLLAVLSLVLCAFSLAGGFATGNFGPFFALALVALITYLLSRTKYFYFGTYLFTYVIAAVAFARIYRGDADTVDSAITGSGHIALVLAGALLPQGGFALLAALSSIAVFATPLYSHVPLNGFDNNMRTGGVYLTISLLLYGVNVFLSNLDRARLDELRTSNRDLEQARTNLEQRVSNDTAQLAQINRGVERRAAGLRAISEISQALAAKANQDLQELFTFITAAISEQTGFYHVGIFLLDENREYAVLRAANSQGGTRMLARQHQLKVGGTGLVGYVSQSGRARIALDTGADAVFFNNPDLPQTRSEMALPLKVGPRVIGALDVQSEQPSAFVEEDVSALSTLANQLAVIVENSLRAESGESRERRSPFARRALSLGRGAQATGFAFRPDGTLSSTPPVSSPLTEQALLSGDTIVQDTTARAATPALAVPVKLRDRVIGIIHVEAADPRRRWTENEVSLVEAVSERAALALENASLFEATERRAEQERIVADVTSRIGESNDIDRILQTTIQELGRALGATRAFIQLGAPAAEEASDNGRRADPLDNGR